MKQILIFSLMSLCGFGMISCNDDQDIAVPEKLDVTYTNLHGIWALDEWNNEKMEGRYCYLNFNRTDHTFVMYDNLASMYARKQTGTFTIDGNMDDGYTLTGEFDYTHETWKTYVVNELTANSLIMSLKDNPNDLSKYVRCDEIPDGITNDREAERK